DIPASKLKLRVAELLKDEGFIKNFRLLEDPKQGTLRVYLKYGTGNEKMISGLVRVSTPGRRVYVTRARIPSVLGGMGVAFLSTPRGVVTDRDARKQGVGGEVLAYVWCGAHDVTYRQEARHDPAGREGSGRRRRGERRGPQGQAGAAPAAGAQLEGRWQPGRHLSRGRGP